MALIHITSYADIPYFLTSRSILSPACDYRNRKSGSALKIVNMHIRQREYSQMAYEIGPSTQIRTDLCVIVIFSFFRGFIKTL
jgi:hypothetical protein